MRTFLLVPLIPTVLILPLVYAGGPTDDANWPRSRRICSPRQVDLRAYEACHLTKRRSVDGAEEGQEVAGDSHLGLTSNQARIPNSPSSVTSTKIFPPTKTHRPTRSEDDFGQFKRRMKVLKRRSSPPFKRQVTDVPDWRELNFTTYEEVRLFCCRRSCPPEAYYGIC
ncbi:uncharacterized protein LOC135202047 [Macrobrachium nipponense]|uniref:uncharacterized protein LOC135202047 n=1 Tax=Macrobrachium nipponense TaxID=159736 RepID=UPI0030C8AB4E